MKTAPGKAASRYFRGLARNRKGIAAIEFALILPMIIVMLAGTFDIGQALMVDRRMNQIVAAAADITSQQQSWVATSLDAIISGAASIIEPFGNTNLTIQVAVITIDSSNNQTVSWSRAYNTTAWSSGTKSPVTISSTIVESGVQMVVAKATYSLTTPFSTFLRPITGITSYTFSRTAINRPRISDSITLSNS